MDWRPASLMTWALGWKGDLANLLASGKSGLQQHNITIVEIWNSS